MLTEVNILIQSKYSGESPLLMCPQNSCKVCPEGNLGEHVEEKIFLVNVNKFSLFYSKNLQCLSLRKPQSLTSSDAINEEINRAVKMAGMILGAADSLIPRSEPVSWMAGQAGAVCCLERGGRRPGPGRSGIPGMLSEQTPRRRLWECICPPPHQHLLYLYPPHHTG